MESLSVFKVSVTSMVSVMESFHQHGVHTKPLYLLQKNVVRAIAFKSFSFPSTPIFYDLKINE